MRSVILPNDLKIYAQSKFEAQTLYREIFTEKVYCLHGVKISGVVDQEEWGIHKLINVFTIYAIRSGCREEKGRKYEKN